MPNMKGKYYTWNNTSIVRTNAAPKITAYKEFYEYAMRYTTQ